MKNMLHFILKLKSFKIICISSNTYIKKLSINAWEKEEAWMRSQAFRTIFRLPPNEDLDMVADCTLVTPYDMKTIQGTLYLSQNYVCFGSRVRSHCH